MNIAVCIKQVPSTEARITVSPQTSQVDLKAVEWVNSPYDEYALEEALRIREKFGGTVTAISLGPERARTALKTALATGADAALFVSDPALGNADSYVTARALAAVLGERGCPAEGCTRFPYDLILCGTRGVDDDMGYVAVALAEFLGLPHVSSITRLELNPDRKMARAHREIEGATEVIETTLPAVFTTQRGLNEPRYPGLRGMMLAGKKGIPICKLAARHPPADPDQEVGRSGGEGVLAHLAHPAQGTVLRLEPDQLKPRLQVLKAVLPAERKAGRVIEGTPQDAVRELVRALREEAKVV
jgi:electron transfer flavoprotein beta subunit